VPPPLKFSRLAASRIIVGLGRYAPLESENEHDANATVVVNDLSLKTLISLIGRIRQTETPEQFTLRETELDDAYRNADAELREAESNEAPAEIVAELGRVRRLVINAHDFVGESNVHAAIEELNKAVEAKLGLGEAN
jgi:hypothetical protein